MSNVQPRLDNTISSAKFSKINKPSVNCIGEGWDSIVEIFKAHITAFYNLRLPLLYVFSTEHNSWCFIIVQQNL